MSTLVLCDEPAPRVVCPEAFQVAVSNWINSSNVGDGGPRLPPPAGLRLRWNCPFLSSPTPAYPTVFEVQRSQPFELAAMFVPSPTVGHLPRLAVPRQLWRPLQRSSPTVFTAGAGDCDHVQAVWLTIGANAPPVKVSLIGTDGRIRAVADVGANDRLYVEFPDLHALHLSSPTYVTEAIGLDLIRDPSIGLELSTIAQIDARYWLSSPLTGVLARLTGPSGSYVTIRPPEWNELAMRGRAVVAALDGGLAPDPADLAFVQLHAASLWEASVLMGLGFLDGEHPVNTRPDQIDRSLMLAAPSPNIFAYRVTARLPETSGGARAYSSICFASSQLVSRLTLPRCRAIGVPVTRSQRINFIDQGATPDSPVPTADPKDQTICDSDWEFSSGPAAPERWITAPRATDSAITGEPFDDVGEFSSDGRGEPALFRGLTRLERRQHRFKVPFFDSDVWLENTAADHWDRRLSPISTPPIQPDIEYEGLCIPLKDAACRPAALPPSVTLTLDEGTNWRADALATYARGRVAVMMRLPDLDRLTAEAKIGPAFPTNDGSWAATVKTDLAPAQLSYLVGGNLVVDSMSAFIRGFGPLVRGEALCTFEVDAHCAGANLYEVGADGAKAMLSEAKDSERLWLELAEIDIQPPGVPDRYTIEIPLPELEASTVLTFATRVALGFEGRPFHGPITLPVEAPYIGPAPKRPDLCIGIRQLGADFYGRALVRATTQGCDVFSERYDVSLALAPGVVKTDVDFATSRTSGLLRQQTPFDQVALFDAFETLEGLPEHSSYTIGLEYVRPQDTRASQPMLRTFLKRRVGN